MLLKGRIASRRPSSRACVIRALSAAVPPRSWAASAAGMPSGRGSSVTARTTPSRTVHTDDVVTVDVPWEVTIDLPALTRERDDLYRRTGRAAV